MQSFKNLNNDLKILVQLYKTLSLHQKLYDKGIPKISDDDFDKLRIMHDDIAVKNNKSIYNTFKNYEFSYDNNINLKEHDHKMLSIQNIYSYDDLKKFYNKYIQYKDLIAEPKFDGASCSLIYKNGNLISALTRGNGSMGECLLSKIMHIESLPKTAMHDIEYIEIRGELCISYDNFKEINSDNALKTIRNAVAGSIANKSETSLKDRKVDFICYGYGKSSKEFDSYEKFFEYVEKNGFKASSPRVISSDINDIIKYNNSIYQSDQLKYPIDGIVCKINDMKAKNELGTTSHHPRNMISLKTAKNTKPSYIKSIQWNVSRTGSITPVAILDPVEIDNVKISRVTLNNYIYIKEKNVREGDFITINRAGGVIPHIEEIINNDNIKSSYFIPDKCPSCGHEVYQNVSILKCNNKYCKDMILSKIEYFFSSKCIYAKGLSKNRIAMMYNIGMHDILDFLNIDKFKDDILKIEGLGEKSFNNIRNEINRAIKSTSISRLINALGISNLGDVLSNSMANNKDIIQAFQNKDICLIKNSIKEFARSYNGIGEVIIGNINEFFDNLSNIDFIVNIMKYIDKFDVNDNNIQYINAKTAVITGKLSVSRKNFIDKINLYFKINSKITKDTNYLITGKSPTASKVLFAEENGINIISEDEVYKLINSYNASSF